MAETRMSLSTRNNNRNLVVKDNALINASYSLDVSEQRLILLAIVAQRKQQTEVNNDSEIIIAASDYAEMFSVDKQTAYEALRKVSNSLMKKNFSYVQFKESGAHERTLANWVDYITYIDRKALIRLRFGSKVVPLITDLAKRFTSYEIEQVREFTSSYAIRLYELVISWEAKMETPVIPIEDFRMRMGVDPGQYTLLSNFKSRVLTPAIEQINEHSDIEVEYEQHKQGRKIIGLSFSFKKNTRRESKLLERIRNASQADRRVKDGRYIVKKAEVIGWANPGETWAELYKRLSPEYIIVD